MLSDSYISCLLYFIHYWIIKDFCLFVISLLASQQFLEAFMIKQCFDNIQGSGLWLQCYCICITSCLCTSSKFSNCLIPPPQNSHVYINKAHRNLTLVLQSSFSLTPNFSSMWELFSLSLSAHVYLDLLGALVCMVFF